MEINKEYFEQQIKALEASRDQHNATAKQHADLATQHQQMAQGFVNQAAYCEVSIQTHKKTLADMEGKPVLEEVPGGDATQRLQAAKTAPVKLEQEMEDPVVPKKKRAKKIV